MISSLDTRCPTKRADPIGLAAEMLRADPLYKAVLKRVVLSMPSDDFIAFAAGYMLGGGDFKSLGLVDAEKFFDELGL